MPTMKSGRYINRFIAVSTWPSAVLGFGQDFFTDKLCLRKERLEFNNSPSILPEIGPVFTFLFGRMNTEDLMPGNVSNQLRGFITRRVIVVAEKYQIEI